MKLQRGKTTPSKSTVLMMELRSGKIVGRKNVAPSDFKIIQCPFGGFIIMIKRRGEGMGHGVGLREL